MTLPNPAVTAKYDEEAAVVAGAAEAVSDAEETEASAAIVAVSEANADRTEASEVVTGEDPGPGVTSTGNLATIRPE
jgi:hypothetical protein